MNFPTLFIKFWEFSPFPSLKYPSFNQQVSLAVFVIMKVNDLKVGDKITVGIGIPFQLFWSILGWCAVSIEVSFKIQ